MEPVSKVYWLKGRSSAISQSILAKIELLFNLEEFNRLIIPDMGMAIKINMSEIGYHHYIPPVVISSIFERMRSLGAKPVVTDGCSLFKGSRFDGYDWMNTAVVQGFGTGEAFDNQIMLVGGYTNEEGNFFPSDGENLGGVELGSLLIDSGYLLVVSHVTAHPFAGLSGAIYNLGLGLLTGSGKLRVHDALTFEFDPEKCDRCGVCLPYCPTGAISANGREVVFDPRTCNSCAGCYMTCPLGAIRVKPEGIPVFQESLVEAALTARKQLTGGAFYVNFLNTVTPQSDDYPYSDAPFLPDLGILASSDPVALDWATYQMTIRSPGLPGSVAQDLNVLDKGDDKIEAIYGITPVHMLQYAEKMNLGSGRFELLINE